MKVIDTPRTNRIGNQVAYVSPFGQCYHTYVIPRDPNTERQRRMRDNFGSSSRGWGLNLTEPQRQRWGQAALTAPSQPSLGQYSHLSGQQLCVKINSTLRCVGQAPLEEPPAPVVFGPNPVGGLVIVNDEEGGLRLLLSVGPAAEDIMLFGQAPCSAGRMKPRRVNYLALLEPATDGQCDITAEYVARFGQPRPGQKVFVVTCQEKNGWKAQDHVTSAIVPPSPLPGEQPGTQPTPPNEAATIQSPEPQTAPTQGDSLLSRAVYKGSTPAAPRMRKGQTHEHPLSTLGTSLVHGVRMAMAALGMLSRGWARG